LPTVPPILLSIISCERVILDQFSGMGTVQNIVQTINALNYPARHARIVLFAELTNGHGKVKVTITLVDIQKEDEILLKQELDVEFKNVKQIVSVIRDMQGLVFPHPGEYRFQFFAEEHLLGERRIVCRQITLKKPENPDETRNK